jgi:integrase
LQQVSDLTVNEIALPYLKFGEEYYRKRGEPTSEIGSIKRALKPLVNLYGMSDAKRFGPLALRAYREQLIGMGLSRGVINNHVSRVKRMFKWATERELIPPSVFHGLQAVTGLRMGRSAAKETSPVKPVDEATIDATLERLNRQVGAMVQVQRYTGMRPGEVIIMRGRDLDMRGRVWMFTPESHKTEHHGRKRVIFLGPRAQAVLKPFLKADLNAYLFSPKDGWEEHLAGRRAARRSPMTPSQRKRQRKTKLKRAPGNYYTTQSYERAIREACDRAFPLPATLVEEQAKCWRREHRWSPNQLRHTAATYLRKEFGIEAARVVLGHRSAAVTEIYAELDIMKAAEIMGQVG